MSREHHSLRDDREAIQRLRLLIPKVISSRQRRMLREAIRHLTRPERR